MNWKQDFLTFKSCPLWIKEHLTFEAFNGWFVFIPWGIGFVWCGAGDLTIQKIKDIFENLSPYTLGYRYALITTGIALIIWGIRKGTVNRVKQSVKVSKMVDVRLNVSN